MPPYTNASMYRAAGAAAAAASTCSVFIFTSANSKVSNDGFKDTITNSRHYLRGSSKVRVTNHNLNGTRENAVARSIIVAAKENANF